MPTDSTQIVARILTRHRVATCRYFFARPQTPVQDGLKMNATQRALVADALSLRASTGIPFIDSVLIGMLNSGPDEKLLSAIGRHYSYKLKSWDVQGGALSRLRVLQDHTTREHMLVLSSKVALEDGRIRHIPMLDFRFAASSRNERLAIAIIRTIGAPSGFLLESGNSYHYYGNSLLTSKELRSFLSKALIYGPIVDKAWIAHQLQDGACGLRISARPTFGYPRLVAHVEAA